MNIRQRILDYLIIKDISRYRFYKDTGLSNGFLDKDGAINSDNCEKICYCYQDINPEWLLTGKGEMLKSPSIEALVNKIVELSSENSLLKRENETLKQEGGSSKTMQAKPYDESDIPNSIAAESVD